MGSESDSQFEPFEWSSDEGSRSDSQFEDFEYPSEIALRLDHSYCLFSKALQNDELSEINCSADIYGTFEDMPDEIRNSEGPSSSLVSLLYDALDSEKTEYNDSTPQLL